MLLESLIRKYGKNGVKNAIRRINESIDIDLTEEFQISLNNNGKEGRKNIDRWKAAKNELQTKGRVDIHIPLDYNNILDAVLEKTKRSTIYLATKGLKKEYTSISDAFNALQGYANDMMNKIKHKNTINEMNENIDDDFETRELIYREFYNAMEHACLSLQRKGIEITEDVVRTGVEWFDLHNDFYEV